MSALRDVDPISRMRSELKQLSTLDVGIEMPERVRNTAPELGQFLAGLMTPVAHEKSDVVPYLSTLLKVCL